jgi:hypothetical protein
MSDKLQDHVNSIAANLTKPPLDEWNEGRDVENEGEFSAFDYLQDALDIEYIVNSKREFLGARVLVAFGGPNIWVNTRTNTIEGHWWGESASATFIDVMGLNEALEELYSC